MCIPWFPVSLCLSPFPCLFSLMSDELGVLASVLPVSF